MLNCAQIQYDWMEFRKRYETSIGQKNPLSVALSHHSLIRRQVALMMNISCSIDVNMQHLPFFNYHLPLILPWTWTWIFCNNLQGRFNIRILGYQIFFVLMKEFSFRNWNLKSSEKALDYLHIQISPIKTIGGLFYFIANLFSEFLSYCYCCQIQFTCFFFLC